MSEELLKLLRYELEQFSQGLKLSYGHQFETLVLVLVHERMRAPLEQKQMLKSGCARKCLMP